MKNLSASAINTFRICPRKYFYHYIQKIPEKPNILLIGGKAVHQAIQEKIRSPPLSMDELFRNAWEENRGDLGKLHLPKNIESRFFHRYLNMARNWERMQVPGTIRSEVKLVSKRFSLVGLLDEIVSIDGRKGIVENKTSSSDRLTDEIRLQLGIYALLYFENFRVWPDFLMVRFLANGTYQLIDMNYALVQKAIDTCRIFQRKTFPTETKYYPRNIGRYCQWKNGECSYFDICRPFQNSSN